MAKKNASILRQAQQQRAKKAGTTQQPTEKEYLVRLEVITSTGSKDSTLWEKGVGRDDVAASKVAIKKLKLRKGWKANYTKQFKELK